MIWQIRELAKHMLEFYHKCTKSESDCDAVLSIEEPVLRTVEPILPIVEPVLSTEADCEALQLSLNDALTQKERMGGWEGERGWGVGREREILSTVHFTDINVYGMRESERETRGKREGKR